MIITFDYDWNFYIPTGKYVKISHTPKINIQINIAYDRLPLRLALL